MNPTEISSSSSDEFFDEYANNIIAVNLCLDEGEDSIIEQVAQMVVAPFAEESSNRRKSYKKRNYIDRDREAANTRLMNDYFVDHSLYPESMFRRKFRMHRSLFLRVVEAVTVKQPEFFEQRPDATGKQGATPIQKCTTALRMLAYGVAADIVDEYIKIGESTTRKSLAYFVKGVREAFTEEYLRRPTVTDLQRLLYDAERSGFPGMMGGIDCMHWQWKNCPRAWKGLYRGTSKSATVILEAVASSDLWIWHAFFGTPGRHQRVATISGVR